MIPARRLPTPQDESIQDPVVSREIARAQRIIEGTSFDIRHRLIRYSRLVEGQRRTIEAWRTGVLDGTESAEILAGGSPERWRAVEARFGAARARRLETRLTLLSIDRRWSDHLAHATEIRDSVHVVSFVGKDPLTEFGRQLGAAFLLVIWGFVLGLWRRRGREQPPADAIADSRLDRRVDTGDRGTAGSGPEG